MSVSEHHEGTTRAGHALDAANFFLADVRQGLGPYLAVYLLTEQKWDEAHIGVVMSVAAIVGILAQTPAGALVDATRAKRHVMAGAALVVMAASLMLPLFPTFWPVAVSQGIANAAEQLCGQSVGAGNRVFTLTAVATANAGYWVPGPYGPIYVPTCVATFYGPVCG